MQCAPNCTRCTISFHLCGTTAWLLLLLLSVFVLNFRYWPQCFLFSQHFWFRQMKSFTIFGRSSILFVFLYSFLFVRSLQHLGTILRCVLFFYMLFFFACSYANVCTAEHYKFIQQWGEVSWMSDKNQSSMSANNEKRCLKINTSQIMYTMAEMKRRRRKRQINFIGHWLNVNSICGKLLNGKLL